METGSHSLATHLSTMDIYDTPEAEKARKHFLRMYERARTSKKEAPTEEAFLVEYAHAHDPVMSNTGVQSAVRWVKFARKMSLRRAAHRRVQRARTMA